MALHRDAARSHRRAIHQLPHALFDERPGPWTAELYVNGQLEGTYPFDVR
jgi:hypothetical protein